MRAPLTDFYIYARNTKLHKGVYMGIEKGRDPIHNRYSEGYKCIVTAHYTEGSIRPTTSSIKGHRASFTRCFIIPKSLRNLWRHPFLVGAIPLKCLLLRSFQMLQAATMKISMNMGCVQTSFAACSSCSLLPLAGHEIPNSPQHSLLKSHSKKRCSTVSSRLVEQSKQE